MCVCRESRHGQMIGKVQIFRGLQVKRRLFLDPGCEVVLGDVLSVREKLLRKKCHLRCRRGSMADQARTAEASTATTDNAMGNMYQPLSVWRNSSRFHKANAANAARQTAAAIPRITKSGRSMRSRWRALR